MSNNIAEELLDDIDRKVEEIEEKELNWWARFKRRFFKGRFLAGYIFGGNVTLLQLLAGKKVLAWFVLKFPILTGGIAKAWGVVVATVTGAFHLIFH